MLKILFILLISHLGISNTPDCINYIPEDFKHTEIAAVLFVSETSLETYLAENNVYNAILIDIENQTQSRITQEEIKKVEEVTVFDYYKWEKKPK